MTIKRSENAGIGLPVASTLTRDTARENKQDPFLALIAVAQNIAN
jgi:hypothetical protein